MKQIWAKIQKEREKLVEIYERKKDFQDAEVYRLSQAIDELVVNYMKKQLKNPEDRLWPELK
ncbi:Spo0E family sporulation regulatory protein-aspartic acid phosphatase [Carboxydothermus islandicus]|uniref:Spo0E family sporulation regulatory protein-aspartic acid phosphatase n=1 Tax=Carboxydothermus islandicus TaxID=661089 RepID=A0A1L8D5Q3_9THEO|nr:aspartyl-phosphate phosphatase Spo0E family protein [Carboxydothermus islandicus]GAV26411.1 Spo0E family sporulation regulatory protein-aspartic acid phosphatase [Carboxydothermus islandicus]